MPGLDVSEILGNLAEKQRKSKQAIEMLAETQVKNLEKKAKKGALWTDRTGHARQRMTGYVTHPGGNKIRLNLAHGVEYGIYLELAYEKKYAIIEPTIRLEGQDVLKSFENLMERL